MKRLFLIGLSALSLSACQLPDRGVPDPYASQGVTGNWASTGGPVNYMANFSGGTFTSREIGTNAVLASGTYRELGPGQVSINYRSATRNQEVAANCNQVEANLLSCASSSGNRFELRRS